MITWTDMAEITGIGSGISATWEESMVKVLPITLQIENTNGTSNGWNRSVITTYIKGYPENTPREEIKQHQAIIHVGGLKRIGIRNIKLRRILAAKLYLFWNTCFSMIADMHEESVENPIERLFKNMLPPMYLVYIISK